MAPMMMMQRAAAANSRLGVGLRAAVVTARLRGRGLASASSSRSFSPPEEGGTEVGMGGEVHHHRDVVGGSRRRGRTIPDDGVTLSHFIASASSTSTSSSADIDRDDDDEMGDTPMPMGGAGPHHPHRSLEEEWRDRLIDVGDDDAIMGDGGLKVAAAGGETRVHDDGGSLARPATRRTLKFHLRTYGCQMNVSDSDIVRSILLNHGRGVAVAGSLDSTASEDVDGGTVGSNLFSFEETDGEMDADVLLTNTCAIRENAESKIWNRLRELRATDAKIPLPLPLVAAPSHASLDGVEVAEGGYAQDGAGRTRHGGRKKKRKGPKRVIGVLGCMAERLKEDMFRDGTVDLVAGPDAYRDLPRLLSILATSAGDGKRERHRRTGESNGLQRDAGGDGGGGGGGGAGHGRGSKKTGGGGGGGGGGFVDLEFGRAVNVQLSLDETYADVTPVRKDPNDVSAFVSVMRGCNNMCSYCVVPFTRGRERSRDLHSIVEEVRRLHLEENVMEVVLLGQNVNSYHDKSPRAVKDNPSGSYSTSNDGFANLFRLRGGAGYYFADLVESVSDVSPELRVRFTSPHPKDYPPELLHLMAERHNVCSQLHLPAQSGSTSVLRRMRRGYDRDTYLRLVDDVRSTVPDVALSSDIIVGFCGETAEEHGDTLSLMESVVYDQAFTFAYSMRGRTHAHRSMVDDVPHDVKMARLGEVIDVFRTGVQRKNDGGEVGRLRVVLVEGMGRRSTEDGVPTLTGRTDQNRRVVFPRESCLAELPELPMIAPEYRRVLTGALGSEAEVAKKVSLEAGNYVVVEITEARGTTLRGRPLWRTTLQGFNELEPLYFASRRLDNRAVI